MTLLKTVLSLWYLLEYCLDAIWYKLWGSSEERDEEDIRGKVVVITGIGVNFGVGKSLGLKLADRGAVVVLGCHNMTEGKITQDDIMYETKSRKVFLFQLDLENFSSVREFADQVTKQFPQIHILTHMGSNHLLGHFLLTNLLLPNLQNSAPSRVIVITSSSLLFSELDIDHEIMILQNQPTNPTILAFFKSSFSIANCLFVKELGSRLKGMGVSTYSVCPGLTRDTKIFRKDSTIIEKIMEKVLLAIVGLSPDRASESLLYCLLSRRCDNETGKFYRFEKVCLSGNRKLKTETAKRLWQINENAVKYY